MKCQLSYLEVYTVVHLDIRSLQRYSVLQGNAGQDQQKPLLQDGRSDEALTAGRGRFSVVLSLVPGP